MSTRANVVASYLGQGWSAIMATVFLPLYARQLGMEAYGLVGIFAILQAWIVLMDLGLSPAISRETARLRAKTRDIESTRDLLRSLEVVCAVSVCAVALLINFSAVWIAGSWLNVQGLSPGVVVGALKIMGVVLALRWLEQFYRGALQGLQDLVWFNAVQVILSTLRWAGSFVVLDWHANVEYFFVWQGIVSCTAVTVWLCRTYYVLPDSGRRATFSLPELKHVRSFASGMFVGGLLAFFLTQSDKIVISRLLPLKVLGSYTLAASAAGGLLQIMAPMGSAIYPRLTELVERGDKATLAATYQRACEWIAALVIPPAMVMAFVPRDTMLMWTGDAALAGTVAPLLAVLSLGTLGNAFMSLPYFLQLAHGWTSLSVRINMIAVVVVIPLLIVTVHLFGAIGAAFVWFALNLMYIIVTGKLMYDRILHRAKNRWYWNALILPLAAALIASALATGELPTITTRLAAAGVVALLATGLFCVMIVVLPAVRSDVLRIVLRHAKT